MADFDLFEATEQTELSPEMLEDINRLDNDIRACFNSRSGRRVLKHLEEISSQPSFDANLGLFNGIANGFAREGQVALIQYLKMRMLRAERTK